MIYDLKIINQKIREDLKEAFPNLTFSVKKDSRKIYISLVAGNFRPFKALTSAEEKGYTSLNPYYIESDPSLTDEAKDVMSKVKEITNKYNYDNSDIQSDYFDVNFYLGLSIGSYDKPYKFEGSSKSSNKKPKTEEKPSSDDLMYAFNGWTLYKRNVKGKVVYVVVKDKATPSNKDSWDLIKGEIYTQTGFKWNRSFQHFDKWETITDDAIPKLDAIFKKYYPSVEEQNAEPTPKEEQVPQEEEKKQPKDERISEYLKTFKNPSEVTNKEERLEILDTLQTILDNFFDVFRSDKDRFFNIDNTRAIFTDIMVGDKVLDLLDGLRVDFSNDETKRNTLIEILRRITEIGGIEVGYLDIVFGVEVTVDGEVESETMKKVAARIAEDDNKPFRVEDWFTGGALSVMSWYSFQRTINAAKNYLNNEFEASFKYADFSDNLKKEMKQKDVMLDDEDYKGNPIKSEARLYVRDKGDKYVYLLTQGGYTGLYSNSWEVGYKMMKAMVQKKSGLLDYVKDVDPFGASKVGAQEYLHQLTEQAPELFPKSLVQTDKQVVQEEIDNLEQFLKDFPDLSDDEKRLILSQILDLHNLLKLI